jgi:hypothetical protein
MNALDALKHSIRMSRGYRFSLLGFIILAALFSFAGLFVFVIGVTITSFLVLIANAHLYRQMSREYFDDLSQEIERDGLALSNSGSESNRDSSSNSDDLYRPPEF